MFKLLEHPPYAKSLSLNVLTKLSSGASCQVFGLTLYLLSKQVCVNSEGSNKKACQEHNMSPCKKRLS